MKLALSKSTRILVLGAMMSGVPLGGFAQQAPAPDNTKAEEIARSLEGNWQEDLLFLLQQEQAGYEFCQKQMAECDASCSTISRKGRTEARGPVCRKRNANDDSTRTRRTIRSSTCASNYFAPPGPT